MRLPAVAIAELFACGVVLGQTPWFAERVSSHVYLAIGFAAVSFLICAGIVVGKIGRLFPAATLSISSWILLGAMGAGIADQPRPADYILYIVGRCCGTRGFEDAAAVAWAAARRAGAIAVGLRLRDRIERSGVRRLAGACTGRFARQLFRESGAGSGARRSCWRRGCSRDASQAPAGFQR